MNLNTTRLIKSLSESNEGNVANLKRMRAKVEQRKVSTQEAFDNFALMMAKFREAIIEDYNETSREIEEEITKLDGGENFPANTPDIKTLSTQRRLMSTTATKAVS